MSKIVNITSKEDKDQKLQDIANSLQELKDVMAEVIEAYEEDNADSRKMDTLTEALDALEDAYEAVSDVLLEELKNINVRMQITDEFYCIHEHVVSIVKYLFCGRFRKEEAKWKL